MSIVEQIFADGLALETEDKRTKIVLKKQPSKFDFWDMELVARKDIESFLENKQYQAQLAKHVSNIDKYEFEGEEIDLDANGIGMMHAAVFTVWICMQAGIIELKKK